VIGSGASGQVRGHWVRLNRVELGLKSVSDTPAVTEGDRSLLGQTFAQFGSVEIHNDTMVLR
jgi:predicted aspartyl protease